MFFNRHSSYDFFSSPSPLYVMLHAMLFGMSVFFFFLNIMSVNLTCFIKSYSLLFLLFGFIFISLCTYSYIRKIWEHIYKGKTFFQWGSERIGEKLWKHFFIPSELPMLFIDLDF